MATPQSASPPTASQIPPQPIVAPSQQPPVAPPNTYEPTLTPLETHTAPVVAPQSWPNQNASVPMTPMPAPQPAVSSPPAEPPKKRLLWFGRRTGNVSRTTSDIFRDVFVNVLAAGALGQSAG